MIDNKTAGQNEVKSKISWTGFLVGLAVGAGLFYLTIQIISALMFSRTAA